MTVTKPPTAGTEPGPPRAVLEGRHPGWQRLGSMVRKEFIEIRRDRRTLALIVAVPVILLVIFGYAANFQVQHIQAEIAGHDSLLLRSVLATHGDFAVRPGVAADQAAAESERERGTIEQLMITPVRKLELMLGKTIPYLVIGLCDLVIVLLVSWMLFNVPVRGSLPLLFGEALLFLTATLGMGLVISTVARTQLQAMQMSVFVQLPQMLLSGLIFPLAAMPWGVRWISYLLPLTYFVSVARGVLLKGIGLADLWPETIGLAILAVSYVGLAALRFRKTLD